MSSQAPLIIVEFEQPPSDTISPSILELASSAPRFTQVVFCLLPILLVFASKKTTKPPVRLMRSHKSQSGSLTPIALPDSQSKAADASKSIPEIVDEKVKVTRPRGPSFSTKITHLGTSIKDTSKTKARRLSIPVRRMSFAIHRLAPHLTPNHHHIDREADSYFFTKKSINVAGGKDVGEKAKVDSVSTAVKGASETSTTTASPDAETTQIADIAPEETVKGEAGDSSASLKRASAFRRAARRASVALKITHRS
ncbi:hypothetical protein H0H87_003339 [Tephrocybe sp. NHM501043]|nr:hypothetical protein H0H87_003339 [Tephrocybe sp. NHM501043]